MIERRAMMTIRRSMLRTRKPNIAYILDLKMLSKRYVNSAYMAAN